MSQLYQKRYSCDINWTGNHAKTKLTMGTNNAKLKVMEHKQCSPLKGITMSERSLSDIMDFDHVIQVLPDGTVTENNDGHYAPDMEEGELQQVKPFWSLMTGYTGQYGYNGPSMHSSEFIGGRMARDILSTPGFYVAVVDKYMGCYNDPNVENPECDIESGCDCDDNGWAVAYHHSEA